MKKIISLLLTSIILASSVFAGLFDNRFIEVRIDAPVGVTNNVLVITDLFQEDLVIDLGELADSVPDSGFTLATSVVPDVSVGINLFGAHIGVDVGADIYGSFNLDKSVFDFLGKGYSTGETLRIQPSLNSQVFATVTADVGLKFGKTKINLTPSLFIPIFSAEANNLGFNFKNTSDGKFTVSLDGAINTYSQFAASDALYDFTKINLGNGQYLDLNLENRNLLLSQALAIAGIDLGGSAELPLMAGLSFIASVRVPIVPGKFNTKTSLVVDSSLSTITVSDIKELLSSDESIDLGNYFEYGAESTEDVQYKINRPLKLNGYVRMAPFGNFITFTGGGGMGIRSPFTEEASVFPEYYLCGKMSLLGGLLGASISTEYTSEIYVHKVGLSVSLRLIELDIAASLQGTELDKSFKGSGFGLYVGAAVGI